MKREQRERRGKVNNLGLTLVEVIIAMAILSIVVVPLMSIMVTTSRYNAKARLRQGMTLTAESLMETFKAYSLNELLTQANASGFNGFEQEGAGGEVTYSGTYDTTTKKYTFEIEKLKNESQLYDVEITAVPYESTTSLLTLEDMNPYTDAMLRMQEVYDASAVSLIQAHFQSSVVGQIQTWLNNPDNDKVKNDYELTDISPNYIKCKKREIIVKIEKGATNTTVSYSMNYYYMVEDYPYYATAGAVTPDGTHDFMDVSGGTPEWFKVQVIVDIPMGYYTMVAYDNANEANLERVFLYYYPAYGGLYLNGSDIQDEIRIETTGFGVDSLECYLLKQINTRFDETTIRHKENSYGPQIVVDSGGTDVVNLRHNIEEHLYEHTALTYTSYSGDINSKSSYMTDTSESYQLMYKVQIDMKEAGESEVIASLSGTVSD
ncbi:MAG: prepilin-type N-terminal cleavage/methylation domain-containing protein [Lachnospiraceae bacterium]|nr:prepilin-type N-terminal cleavage/methylation domain-containing protein [Lachnospiraceae bacterium]